MSNKLILNFDVPQPWQYGFQDAASPTMEAIIEFHNYVMIFITFIVIGVLYILISICIEFSSTNRFIAHKYLNHGTLIETIWTIFPAVILVFIAYPSFKLLYLMDEVIDPILTIKVIGHQWYWSYEFSDYAHWSGASIQFDSYMVPENDLTYGSFRLLETDAHLIVPSNSHIRVIITSADVLHSWSIPSLGVKLDAVPGRLNQTGFLANREGIFYGQCSEICGANHAFMPIVVESTSLDNYCLKLSSLLSDA